MSARAVAAFALVMLAAGAAPAQEYGRASGGEIDVVTKRPAKLSGSLGLTQSAFFGKRFEGTLGGTAIPDRLWFFGSASVGAPAPGRARVDAYLADRQSLAAIARRSQPAPQTLLTAPASFLSLHYTGVLSDRAFVTASVSQSH